MMAHTFIVLAVAGALLSSGCAKGHYLAQATWGQLDLLSRRQPIEQLLASENTPRKLRDLLVEVRPIKAYARFMGMRSSSNYTHYAQLDRGYAVLNLSASKPLTFEPKVWSFPVVGSFPYLGFFEPELASQYARELEEQGWDVSVRGASAYSTLGWFRDPILSTMVTPSPQAVGDLTNVILHESVHASIHIANQSIFNESIATFIADNMTPGYLRARFGPHSEEFAAYRRSRARWTVVGNELYKAYQELAALYASELDDEQKIARKKALLGSLMERLNFRRRINNATLNDFKNYRSGQEDFGVLFRVCGQQWPRFMEAIAGLGAQDFSEPHQKNLRPVLGRLIDHGCSAQAPTRSASASDVSPKYSR